MQEIYRPFFLDVPALFGFKGPDEEDLGVYGNSSKYMSLSSIYDAPLEDKEPKIPFFSLQK